MASGFRPAAPGLAVGRHRKLEDDVRPAIAHPADVAGVIAARLVGSNADVDGNSRRTKPFVPRARDLGFGVFQRGDNARNTGRNNRVRARRCLAVVRARLKRHTERRAVRRVACATQRLDFRMRPPAGLCPAAADDHAVFDDHRADRRIWPCTAEPAPAERERERHEAAIIR